MDSHDSFIFSFFFGNVSIVSASFLFFFVSASLCRSTVGKNQLKKRAVSFAGLSVNLNVEIVT